MGYHRNMRSTLCNATAPQTIKKEKERRPVKERSRLAASTIHNQPHRAQLGN